VVPEAPGRGPAGQGGVALDDYELQLLQDLRRQLCEVQQHVLDMYAQVETLLGEAEGPLKG